MKNPCLDAALLLVSLGFAQTVAAAKKEPKLKASEEVAFIPVTNVVRWMRGGINNLSVRVGRM